MRFSILNAIALLLVVTVLPAQAQKNTAYWEKKAIHRPNNSIYLFNLANAYQRNKNYSQAIRFYRKVLKKNSNLKHAAMLYLGRAYYKTGQIEKAKKVLQLLSKKNNVSTHLRLKAQGYLHQIEKQNDTPKETLRERFRGRLKVRHGYNSNPFFESESGLDINGKTVTVEADQQTQYQANLGFKYFSGKSSDAKINFSYTKIDFSSDSSANSSYLGGSLPISIYTPKIRYRLIPNYSVESNAIDTILSTTSGQADLTYKWSVYKLSLALAYLNYRASDSLYEYLGGDGNRLNISFSRNSINGLLILYLSAYQKSLNDSDLLTRSHTSEKLEVSYLVFFKKISASFSLAYQHKIFKEDAIEEVQREDYVYKMDTKVSYALTRRFKTFVEADYTSNASNFDGKLSEEDFNYGKFGIAAGISVSF